MTRLIRFLRRFQRDENGSAAVELCLAVPMLSWALLATLVYFDVFRAEAISNRSALTLADIISRELDAANSQYVSNMREVLRVLTDADQDPDLRVTSYYFDASSGTDGEYRVVWSEDAGFGAPLTDSTLSTRTDRLPVLADRGTSLLIETRTGYSPPFTIGMELFGFDGANLESVTFSTFTVITPRFLGEICFDPTPSDTTNGDTMCVPEAT